MITAGICIDDKSQPFFYSAFCKLLVAQKNDCCPNYWPTNVFLRYIFMELLHFRIPEIPQQFWPAPWGWRCKPIHPTEIQWCYVCLHKTALYNGVCCAKLAHRAMLKTSVSTPRMGYSIYWGRQGCLQASTAAPATLGSTVVCMKHNFSEDVGKKKLAPLQSLAGESCGFTHGSLVTTCPTSKLLQLETHSCSIEHGDITQNGPEKKTPPPNFRGEF